MSPAASTWSGVGDGITWPARMIATTDTWVRVRSAVRQTRAVFDAVHVDVVIGFGGYVSVPAYPAARIACSVRCVCGPAPRCAVSTSAPAWA